MATVAAATDSNSTADRTIRANSPPAWSHLGARTTPGIGSASTGSRWRLRPARRRGCAVVGELLDLLRLRFHLRHEVGHMVDLRVEPVDVVGRVDGELVRRRERVDLLRAQIGELVQRRRDLLHVGERRLGLRARVVAVGLRAGGVAPLVDEPGLRGATGRRGVVTIRRLRRRETDRRCARQHRDAQHGDVVPAHGPSLDRLDGVGGLTVLTCSAALVMSWSRWRRS